MLGIFEIALAASVTTQTDIRIRLFWLTLFAVYPTSIKIKGIGGPIGLPCSGGYCESEPDHDNSCKYHNDKNGCKNTRKVHPKFRLVEKFSIRY